MVTVFEHKPDVDSSSVLLGAGVFDDDASLPLQNINTKITRDLFTRYDANWEENKEQKQQVMPDLTSVIITHQINIVE